MFSVVNLVVKWQLKLEAVDAIDNLKKKVIESYNIYLNRMYLGYKPSYEHILQMICLIENYDNLDNNEIIYEYLISK